MGAEDGSSWRGDRGPGPDPRPALRCWRVFPGNNDSVPALRRWLSTLLPDCPARADLLLVATELAANALMHTASRGGLLAAEVTCHEQAVRITVADQGAPDGPLLIRGPADEHGRGLQIVRALSARAGVTGDHRGRRVWGR
jgi:serine/threonine-protein kinase RsbW